MSDILTALRLAAKAHGKCATADLLTEAAGEIERLRDRNELIVDGWLKVRACIQAVNESLAGAPPPGSGG